MSLPTWQTVSDYCKIQDKEVRSEFQVVLEKLLGAQMDINVNKIHGYTMSLKAI